MTTKYIKIAAIVGPVALFVIATVFLAIEAASYGAKLHSLEAVEAELASENRELSNMLITTTSLGELSARSQELGFLKPEKIIYITNDRVIANAN